MNEPKEIIKTIRMSAETSKLYESMMGSYAQSEDKQGDALHRILEAAQQNYVKATHPDISNKISSIEATARSLLEQVNGIVSAQDDEIRRLNDIAIDYKKEHDDVIENAEKSKEELNDCRKRENLLLEKIKSLEKANAFLEQQLDALKDSDPEKLHKLEVDLSSAQATIKAQNQTIALLKSLIPVPTNIDETNNDLDF